MKQPGFLKTVAYSFQRIARSLASEGLHTTFEKILYRIQKGAVLVHKKYAENPYGDPDAAYHAWLKKHPLTPEMLNEMRSRSAGFKHKPVISIVMPVYNPPLEYFKEAVRSILEQSYPFLELCISDDGSPDQSHRDFLESTAERDPRLHLDFKKTNEGIIPTSQKAVSLASGEFIAFMDQDDLLPLDSLFRVAEKLNEDPVLDILYSDNDRIDLNGTRLEVYFKPDYSPDEFLSHNYIGHLTVMRASLFRSLGGFSTGYEGAQDYEILLKATEKTDRIAHIPHVLYHWRKSPGSTASTTTAKSYAYVSGEKALEDHIRRKGLDGDVQMTPRNGVYRCRFKVKDAPLVSVIAMSSDTNRLKLLKQRTSYPKIEIVTVGNSASNPAMMNAGVKNASGQYFVFWDEFLEPGNPEWLEALLEPAQRPGVGIVGAKTLSSDKKIRHGGLALGFNGTLGTLLDGVPDSALLYEEPHHVVRNCSAVSLRGALITAKAMADTGAFDEELGGDFYCADFCLRAKEKGYWSVWTPFAVLTDRKLAGKRTEQDAENFRKKWPGALAVPDPFYNVNLTKRYFDFSPDTD